jgi:putative hemolysin
MCRALWGGDLVVQQSTLIEIDTLNGGSAWMARGEPLHAPQPTRRQGPYQLRFAQSPQDLRAALRLRYLVFSLELNEGPESAHEQGYESDEFDKVCDHLLVEHAATRQVVGTYRLQTGQVAARNRGYYSAREFDFSPYERLRNSMLELGRACIHHDHRSFDVLTLLWRGVAAYALQHGARYLIGCSSLTSQSPRDGSEMYWQLQPFLAESALQTTPLPECLIPIEEALASHSSAKPPKLLRAYLLIGARICGTPAIDRKFKTIDFLTLLDLHHMSSVARARFLQPF